MENIQPGYGIFFETGINNLKELKNILLQKLKLFHILVLRKKIKKIITNNKFSGIDRIVKIGRTFEMSNIWDGFDIINILSREIN